MSVPASAAPIPEPAVAGVQPVVVPVATGMTPMPPTSPVAPTAPVVSTAAAPAPAAAPPAAPPAPPAPVTGAEGFGYMVGSFGARLESPLETRAKTKDRAAESTAATAAAPATERDQTRSRRHQRSVIDRAFRYEYMEADDDSVADASTPSALASGSGAESQGFTGTLPKAGVQAAGLMTLDGDEFGRGPSTPMLPESWDDASGREAP